MFRVELVTHIWFRAADKVGFICTQSHWHYTIQEASSGTIATGHGLNPSYSTAITFYSILEDEYFVRPRAPHSQDVSSSGPITDGFASLIIAHYVDRADEDQDTGSACHSSQDSCTSSSSDDNSSHVRDENYGDNGEITKKRKANTSSSKNHSLKFPIHAHLLPTRGRHLSAVLPIIAVADEYNIIPLMSSMLYQRRVWHIDQPVIGIIFQGTGTVGQVLFGWLDHDSGTSGDL
ncbi:hypothetical protein SERLA73DRAFT_69183, partial [Serpula lacrymans var. lacrymans S7.3]